jgi:hypothetical protein
MMGMENMKPHQKTSLWMLFVCAAAVCLTAIFVTSCDGPNDDENHEFSPPPIHTYGGGADL